MDRHSRMLDTSRLHLRLMVEDDLADLHRIFTDANVMKAFGLESFSLEQMKEWLNRNLAHQRQYGYGLFSVVLKATGELIGDCGLEHGQFHGLPCVEIGYDFLSTHWNRGYATEAARRVRDYATEELLLGRDQLCSYIRQSNLASQRVSEKIGMHRISEFQRYGAAYYLYGYDDRLRSGLSKTPG